jgi:hypothetical protein
LLRRIVDIARKQRRVEALSADRDHALALLGLLALMLNASGDASSPG